MGESKLDLVKADLYVESKGEQTKCLRWRVAFQSIKVYVILTAVFNNNLLMFWSSLTGILTSIERRYSFNSSTMGSLLMASEFGPLIVILFISHFSNRYNMPRITAGLYMIFAVAVAMMTLPHYVFSPDSSSSEAASQVICMATNSTSSEREKGTQTNDDSTGIIKENRAAFGIMYAALFIIGTVTAPASTLQFSYMESNTVPTSTVRYIALSGIGSSAAPMLGLFLSAWATSIYVDLSDTHLVDTDPAWAGAWWLALVIIAACILLPSPLLCFFPRRLKDNSSVTDSTAATESDGKNIDKIQMVYAHDSKEQEYMRKKEVYSLKGFFISMRRLLTNPSYMMLIIAYVFWAFAGWGFGSFSPKYYQLEFNLNPWKAAIAAGVTAGVGGAVGRIASAVVTFYFKVSLKKGFIISIFGTLLITLLTGSRIFLGCGNLNLRGQPVDYGKFIMDLSCASGCDCSDTPYNPVCDSGVTYFSPCHAGCTDSNTTAEIGQVLYSSCNCTDTGTATRGACDTECDMFIPYIATMFFSTTISAFVGPFLIVFTMRCVDPVDKTLAYGFAIFLLGLAGFLPGPMLYGTVIDTTCSVWQNLGGGIMGSCWQYDLVSLRYRLQGLTAGCWLVQLTCYVVVYILARNKFEAWEKRSAGEDEVVGDVPFEKPIEGSLNTA